jgi:anti-sigma factor RsiW
MSCTEFEDLILDQIDGLLAPETQLALHNHLAACENCRAFQAEQLDVVRSLLALPRPQLSPQFQTRVLAAIDATSRPIRLRPGFAWDLAGVASLAAAAGFGIAHFLPRLIVGGPWVAAGAVLCAGACLTLADEPEHP